MTIHERRPIDRGHIATEQRNAASRELHRRSVAECLELITREDQRVIDALQEAGPALSSLVEAAEDRFCRGGRVIYVGAGTSGRLGVLDASEAPPTFQVPQGRIVGIIAGGDAALRVSSEHKEDDEEGARQELETLALSDNDTVIGLAAGGTTPYVRGSMRLAKEFASGCLTGFITCSVVEAPFGTDHLVLLDTGPEVLTGSTRMKAGTATKLALNAISTTLMIRAGRVYQNLMVDLRATNDKLRDRAARIVMELTGRERDAAFELLDRAGGAVKPAVVMHARGVDLRTAEALIAEADGRLDRVLENERGGPSTDAVSS